MLRLVGSGAARWIPRRFKTPASRSQYPKSRGAVRTVRLVAAKRGSFLKSVGQAILIMYAVNAVASPIFGKDDEASSRPDRQREQERSETDETEEPSVIFIPFPFTLRRHQAGPFTVTSPEYQTLAQITKGSALETRIKTQAVNFAVWMILRNGTLAQQFGNIVRVSGPIDVWLPVGPPPFYSQAGLLITDNYIAWARRSPAGHAAIKLQERISSPTPVLIALWRHTMAVWGAAFRRVFGLQAPERQNANAKRPPVWFSDLEPRYTRLTLTREEQRRLQERRVADAMRQKANAANTKAAPLAGESNHAAPQTWPGAADLPRLGPTSVNDGSRAGQTSSQNQSLGPGPSQSHSGSARPADSARSVDGTTDMRNVPRWVQFVQAPVKAIRDIAPEAWTELGTTLRALWFMAPAPPRGGVKVSGTVTMEMQRGTIVLDFITFWDPSTREMHTKTVWLNYKLGTTTKSTSYS